MPTDLALTDTALLALDAQGRQIVSVHCKRTYRISPQGMCSIADEQQPLLGLENDPPEPPRETDVTPVKTGTDLIFIASAHPPSLGARSMSVRFGVNGAEWDYAVTGDRLCSYHGPGSISFSGPAPLDIMPLRYEHAYGGLDEHVSEPLPNHVVDFFKMRPGEYPRNPVGRGYVVYENAAAIEGLALPNIEHPRHRLTPQNLVVGGPQNWWRQPIPWSCDWFDKGWYPRVTYFGGLPEHLPDDDSMVAEVAMGLVAPRQNARHAAMRLADALDSRFTNAASPSLVLPFLRGDERVLLEGVTPHGRLVVTLPGQPPAMFVRFEGRAYELRPTVHRVLISTEQMGLYIVWHGAFPTPRQLPDRLPRQGDDPRMELEGIEVFCDGKLTPPLV
ncbi:MAG TPA: DUF2169 domain-containing protein [Polyangiaceae bacterium]|nr:DUF2169 domain-containing protein [Polyangiaceae bacterium]